MAGFRAGASATFRPNATSTSGSTASTYRPGSRTPRSACWSSSARRRRARRNSSASSTAYARAHNLGGTAPRPQAARTVHRTGARGRRWRACWFWQALEESGLRRAASAAGCTRPPMSSTSYRRASNQRPSERCRRSGWARPKGCARRLRRLRRDLGRQIRQGGRVPDQGSRGAAGLLSTSRPSTGNICARPTPSKVRSQQSATARCVRRGVFRTKPRSP